MQFFPNYRITLTWHLANPTLQNQLIVLFRPYGTSFYRIEILSLFNDIILELDDNVSNTELHNLIRRCLILTYLTGSFHSSFIEEYVGGLLMTLQGQDGDIHPILFGDSRAITLFKLQVFGMVSLIARKYYQYNMKTSKFRILM
jgi:hypothetical protein